MVMYYNVMANTVWYVTLYYDMLRNVVPTKVGLRLLLSNVFNGRA